MANKLSTKNIKSDAGVQKVLQPGNNSIQILSVGLESVPYKKDAYHFIMNTVGPDLGKEFTGFLIDKADPSKGNYKGQVGKIKANQWPYSDGETKGGMKISRDEEIMKFIMNLCKEINATKWIEANNDQHDTIEEYVNQFNSDKLYAGKFLKMCIAGREYQNREGYTNYDLCLPKWSKDGVPFEAENAKTSRIIKFDPAVHIIKKKAEVVASFGETRPTGKNTKDDFDL